MKIFFVLSLFLALTSFTPPVEVILKAGSGTAKIKSEAPLEIIKAESKEVNGIIDPASKEFAFSIRMKSFEGFNSDLQKQHFLENYIEEKKYPKATFTGKLIEDVPFSVPGTYSVRAKGNLTIHGVVKERIIRGTLTIRKESARVQTDFFVPVADLGIIIPNIVMQKIAEQIEVNIDIEFIATAKP